MKISKRFVLSLTMSTLLLTLVAGQSEEDSGEREESNIPKKVLRKYRIRRPIILDENGNPITTASVPRLRRIRVKSQEQSVQSVPSLPQPTQNSLESRFENQLNHFQIQRQEPQPVSQQRVSYEDDSQVIIEPVRVSPTYRKATPSSTRSALLANVNLRERGSGDEDSRKQPVGTTRNYSNINDDGSFTFGYTGEDGSFKEETRGTDCVVRGKYGYVDPDGVSREFSYVSGNPCDPNDPNKDDELQEDEGGVDNVPRSPIIRPRRPVTQNVQQNIDQSENERNEQQLPPILRVNPRKRIPTEAPPTFPQPTTFRPRVRISTAQPSSTAAPLFQPQYIQARSAQSQFRQPQQLGPTPFPLTAGPRLDERGANRAFNFNQEFQEIHQQGHPILQQFAQQPQQFLSQQPRPSAGPLQRYPQRQYFGGANAANLFQQQPRQPTPTQPAPNFQQPRQPTLTQPFQQPRQPTPTQQFQQPRQPTPTQQFQQSQQQTPIRQFQQPRPVHTQPQLQTNSIEQQSQADGNYRTEIVFDPESGRHIQILVQNSPTPAAEQYTLTQRLRGFVEPQRQQFQIQSHGQPQIQYYQQHQPTNQQFNPPLFNQNQQIYQPSAGSITRFHADAQEAVNSPASGQIEAFLSNLNISA